MKTILLTCQLCGKSFERKLSEHTKNIKNNITKTFCGLSCSTKNRNDSMTNEYWQNQYKKQKKSFDIKRHSGNRLDEYSPFRFFLNSGRASIKKHKHETDVDLEYLKNLWEEQKGICPYTKIKMILPRTTKESNLKSLKKASLDRIDSSKGYIKGNVEFVCMVINLAKNNYTKKEMEEFITEIKNSSI